MRLFLVLFFGVFGSVVRGSEVSPVPEAEQGAQAAKIIDAWFGARPQKNPKVLQVVYFTPADRDPVARYAQRLEAILEDIRVFYRSGMERQGFGPKTFGLARDAHGQLAIHLVKGKEPANAYARAGSKITGECRPVLKRAGISLERETVLIFCNLADWDETTRTFTNHSPYEGRSDQHSGLCWVADTELLDLARLTQKEPSLYEASSHCEMSVGRFNTLFIGGIAHELGHAFALPHSGERWDEQALGTSLMGLGNHTYREEQRGEGKGSFLNMASAMRLASHPLFSGRDEGAVQRSRLKECELALSTNVTRAELVSRRGGLRLEGTVFGTPPVYGVIAYFDSIHDGGYRATAATSVPDAQGRFAIEISDLAPHRAGRLRVEFCHVNGAVSEKRLEFSVGSAVRLRRAGWHGSIRPAGNKTPD